MGSAESRRRLAGGDHGVLATVHPERGADAVPVCFALDERGAHLVVPIDVVKPKASTALQRTANLDDDPRATLLVERWDPLDWSALWWVRAELLLAEVDGPSRDDLARALRHKYEPYHHTAFADLLTFTVGRVTGWRAADQDDGG